MKINLLDLFSGIGGFSKGLTKSGFKINKHYTSEIDTHAKAIYKHRFPQSIDVGDVRHVRANQLERIDAITFGSPCQDFSLAGTRKGMSGERSSLITEAIRLINECRPKFFIWENVKGTFSSNNGADFWAIIKAFANIGGYRLEWQLLNTAWFLPQNRERIYLVGTLGNTSGKEIFPIEENTKRDIAKIRKKQFVRGRNKNTQGCIDTRGCTRSCRADLDNFIYDYKLKTIRKPTPIENERCQGYEDNWTKYGFINGELTKISDSARNHALGNAVTVDVVHAVGERIMESIS